MDKWEDILIRSAASVAGKEKSFSLRETAVIQKNAQWKENRIPPEQMHVSADKNRVSTGCS